MRKQRVDARRGVADAIASRRRSSHVLCLVGLQAITDGEFRRSYFHIDFLEQDQRRKLELVVQTAAEVWGA